jgi:F-type H+-transporting ATPase subunit delta
MAELATIARPYSEALFQVSGHNLESVSSWLDELALIASDDRLQELDAYPASTTQQVLDVISGVVKTPLDDHAKNFLRTVIDNRRLSALPQIAAQFHLLKNQRSGVFDAEVYSAFPISDIELKDLLSLLEKRFARKLKLSVVTDASLIGGIRVVVGDEVLDTSVKARLEQMKVALTA